MRRPGFFIIGAPKCGTTALYEYLRKHPQICMSWPNKEPGYFSVDFPTYRSVTSMGAYLALWNGCPTCSTALGEASPLYLCSETALELIREFDGSARLIVMVRNPVDLVQSLHNQFLYSLEEDEPSFEKAWRLQPLRKRGYRVPRKAREPSLLQYSQVARLGDQMERLLDVFPRDQIKTIVFEDFIGQTRSVYEAVLSFLGVPSDDRRFFPKMNTRKINRSQTVAKVLTKHGSFVGRLKESLYAKLNISYTGVGAMLLQLNRRNIRPLPISNGLRVELEQEFQDDIEKLGSLIGRDLTHWTRLSKPRTDHPVM